MTSVLHAKPVLASRRDVTPAACASGTWADFDALYREHFRFVWRVVRRLGLLGAGADDVVQEVFLVVHRRLPTFEQRSSAKTWLYGIVRRVVADHRRTLRRKSALTSGAPESADLDAMPSEAAGPEASAEQAERVRLLHRLLAQLDDDKREVFVLAELEGLTIAEIAEALEANANTIASRLRAARRDFELALDLATQQDEALAANMHERRPR
jgi:RNA polymerase sigma-70 factor (ECF subfamily)